MQGAVGRRGRAIVAAVAVAVVAGTTAAAPVGAPTGAPAGRDLERFAAATGPSCAREPARACIDRGFAFVDGDKDGFLSLAEVEAVEKQAEGWAQANAGRLPPAERQKLIMGLLIVQTVGVGQVFASYDADADGRLSEAEATADLRLDERPLPQLLADPGAVNWQQLSSRAGVAAPLLRRFFVP